MPRFAAVSRERHGQKKWLRFNGFGFAAADALDPSSAPSWRGRHSRCRVLFWSNRDATRWWRYCRSSPVATCLSALTGVGWAPTFLPGFGSTRFACLPQQGTDELVLCVDEESGLVVERSAAGEEFFDGEGQPLAGLETSVRGLDGGGTQPQGHRPGCGGTRASRCHSTLADQAQDRSRRTGDQRITPHR